MVLMIFKILILPCKGSWYSVYNCDHVVWVGSKYVQGSVLHCGLSSVS